MRISSNHSRPASTTMCFIPYLKQPGMQSLNPGRQSLHRHRRGQGPWNSAITFHPRLCAHAWHFSLCLGSLSCSSSTFAVDLRGGLRQYEPRQRVSLHGVQTRAYTQPVHGKEAQGGPRCECVCQFSLCGKKLHARTTFQEAAGHNIYKYWKKGKCYH